MRIYISTTGRTSGSGGSSGAAVSYARVLQLVTDDVTLVFLPGNYPITSPLDTTAFTGVCVYGDGKVSFEDKEGETIPQAILLGSRSTVSGIRFKNFRCAVEIPDGHTQSMVKNCFEYQIGLLTPDVIGGCGFKAGLVTQVTFENLTSIRSGPGISAFTGTEVKNCLALARPAILGELSDGFDDTDHWTQLNPLVSFTFQMFESNFYQGEAGLYMAGTNNDPGFLVATFQRTRPVAKAKDLLRGDADKLHLLLFLIDDSGVAASGSSYRYILGDNAGNTIGFNIPKASLSAGFNFLVFDLQAPDIVTGVIDRSTTIIDRLEVDLLGSGSVALQFDYQTLVDDTATYDFNAAELIDGFDVMNAFRGPAGVEATTSPPPFEAPNIEMYKYLPSDPNFVLYTVGGENGLPIGGLWLASHSYVNKEPGHLSFRGHRVISSWENDENFYDTVNDVPGPEAEGTSEPVDQSAVVVSAFNAATTLAASVAFQDLRNSGLLDDNEAHKFSVDATDVVGGASYAFPASFDGTVLGAIALAIEYFIPLGELVNLSATGIDVTVISAGGDITQRFLPAVLHEGWNVLAVPYAAPTFSSGAFDPTVIDDVDVKANKPMAGTLTDHVTDHIFLVVTAGASTGPVIFEANGNMALDLTNFPEAKVGRAVNAPFLIRDVGAFIRSQWQALENADQGSFINVPAVGQELATRTIEYRFSELKFGTYGLVLGALARDWRTLNRVTDGVLEGRELWAQERMTIRNRVPTVVTP